MSKAPTPAPTLDHQMMGIALAMARRGLGRTAPNPAVGAVLLDPRNGEVLSRATTAPGGRPHAEPQAIGAAGARARGATLYVTLEPCSHQGQTAPCADAIVAAGIARVVCAIEDPDPRVAGRGLARLRAAGIAVTRGVRADEAAWLTRGHVVRVSERRPFIELKLALDADGAVPRGINGAPLFVTGPQARALGHLMRAQSDAILVGHGTVAADNPDLTCRLPGLETRSPHRVVLAKHGFDLAGSRLAATAAMTPLTVVTGPSVAAARSAEMRACGACVLEVPIVGGDLWLPAVAEMLAEAGITRLLVEGGPTLWRAFARAGLIDALTVMSPAAAPPDLAAHLGPIETTLLDRRRLGPDTVSRYAVRSSHAPPVRPLSPGWPHNPPPPSGAES